MLSAASPAKSREILHEFEAFHSALSAMFGHPVLMKKRTTIVNFSFEEDFKEYLPKHGDLVAQVDAYTVPATDESLIAMCSAHQDVSLAQSVIFHEYVHQFLSLMDLQLPLWMNEGLAELYSTVDISRHWITYGRSIHAHRQLLVGYSQSLLPLRWLFGVTADSPDYNEGTRQGIFYAESWALLHYWTCSGDPANLQKFIRFLDLMSRPGAQAEPCMTAAFGLTESQMLQALGAYMRTGRYVTHRIPRPPDPADSNYHFRAATAFERDFILADLRLRARDSALARYELVQMAEQHPESPLPCEVLGSASAAKGDARAAVQYWDQAIARGSDNAYVYVLRAALQLDQIGAVDSLAYRMPEEQVQPLRTGLRKAIGLNPHYSAAVTTLAFLESVAAQPDIPSIEVVQKMIGGLRDKRNALLSLAVVRWRLGDRDTCRKIVALLATLPMSGALASRLQALQVGMRQAPAPATAPAAAAG